MKNDPSEFSGGVPDPLSSARSEEVTERQLSTAQKLDEGGNTLGKNKLVNIGQEVSQGAKNLTGHYPDWHVELKEKVVDFGNPSQTIYALITQAYGRNVVPALEKLPIRSRLGFAFELVITTDPDEIAAFNAFWNDMIAFLNEEEEHKKGF